MRSLEDACLVAGCCLLPKESFAAVAVAGASPVLLLLVSSRLLTRTAAMAKTGSPQSEKNKKYDRQLRLWGDEGQALIEAANVCVIGAGATGCEVLKNIVLPGTGCFTLVDDHIVTPEDVSTNFFLTQESIGQNRAKMACKLLQELNEDVRGSFVEDSLQELLQNNPQFFHSFSIVIANDVRQRDLLLQLATLLYNLNIPLIVTKINGLFAYVRVQVKEHVIIESKPDNLLEDLRLDSPPPALIAFCDKQDLEAMDRKDLCHTPYLVILFKCLNEWRSANGKDSKALPNNYKDKEQLRQVIRDAATRYKQKFSGEEDRDLDLGNFEEAVKAVNILVPSSRIPSETKDVLSMQALDEKRNRKFWLLVRALDQFVKERSCLPIRGAIPDMTSDSRRYIELQRIYADQAKQDVTLLTSIVSSESDGSELSDSEITTFCRNAHGLRVLRTPALKDEYEQKGDSEPETVSKLRQMVASDDMTNDRESFLSQYLMFRSVDDFHVRYQRLPGTFDDQQEEDVVKLKSCLRNVLTQVGAHASASREDLLQAFVAFGGSDIHSVAAFVGGVAGHEVIKLLTRQFVPLNHTLLYNAITSLTQIFTI